MKAKQLMTTDPQTISVLSTIPEARNKMQQLQCLHLPVVEGDKLVGVVSDRDLKAIEKTPSESQTRVEDIMTDGAYIVSPETDIRIVAKEMLEEKIHSVIVREKDSSEWGIITVTDFLHYVANSQKFLYKLYELVLYGVAKRLFQ